MYCGLHSKFFLALSLIGRACAKCYSIKLADRGSPVRAKNGVANPDRSCFSLFFKAETINSRSHVTNKATQQSDSLKSLALSNRIRPGCSRIAALSVWTRRNGSRGMPCLPISLAQFQLQIFDSSIDPESILARPRGITKTWSLQYPGKWQTSTS